MVKEYFEHVKIDISEEEIEFHLENFNEEGDESSLSHEVLNIPKRSEMTEREQMLFVIKCQKATLHAIEASPGFYIDFMEQVEDLEPKEQLQAAYCFFGDYDSWEFED